MNVIKKLLENKYGAGLKKFIISVFTRYDFTLVDMIVFVIACTAQSWWMVAFYILWIFVISPSLVATKENLDKLEENKQDEHSQL
jgi:phage shock protein PspC (stress-responsive transcriptional regulator)